MFILKENDHWEYISEKSGSAVLFWWKKDGNCRSSTGSLVGQYQWPVFQGKVKRLANKLEYRKHHNLS